MPLVFCDVNVLLNAHLPRLKHHAVCRAAVLDVLARDEPFAISELVLAAVVRLATNPRIFQPPASPQTAFAFADTLRRHPHALIVSAGGRHWDIFQDLVLSNEITGSDTTDAYLAALALEHGCAWWTTDAGFGRFAGLRWRNLLER